MVVQHPIVQVLKVVPVAWEIIFIKIVASLIPVVYLVYLVIKRILNASRKPSLKFLNTLSPVELKRSYLKIYSSLKLWLIFILQLFKTPAN